MPRPSISIRINALVNDQLKSLFRINLALGKEAVGVRAYTGALSSDKRKAARARNPHIWLTNPEMLHLSFLLWHANWEDLCATCALSSL